MNFRLLYSLLLSLFVIQSAMAQTKYVGSSYNQVVSALHDVGVKLTTEDQKNEFDAYKNQNLPHYEFSSWKIFNGQPSLAVDAKRTINERFDVYDYLPKKLHLNGICVTGTWQATDDQKYSGLFSNSKKALFVGRISTTLGNVEKEDKRGFGFTGKIFPTLKPNEVVKTVHFFSVDVLLGTKNLSFLDAQMTNKPTTGTDISMVAVGLYIAKALSSADKDPGYRPVFDIAAIGEEGSIISAPQFIKIKAQDGQIKNNETDFRNEVMQAVRDNRILKFDVMASDSTADVTSSSWRKVAEIDINDAVVSYSCDRRVHFAHPKLNP